MKKIWCVIIILTATILWIPSANAQECFSVKDGIISGKTTMNDGFTLFLDLSVPKNEFVEPVPRMTAKKYYAESGSLRNIWDTYVSSYGESELCEPQIFTDTDSKVGTQYVYSDRAVEMIFQIIGINSTYRRQEDIQDDIDKEAIVRCILSDLGIDIEYPFYYIAKGSVDYANIEEGMTPIRNTDTLFIARQMIMDYPMAASRRFMHNQSVYTGGFIAIVLDNRNNLVYLDLHNIINVSRDKKNGISCVSWQTALKSFLDQKKDLSFETFDERRISSITPKSMTIYSMAPAMLFDDENGKITPIWEIEGKIEFDQILSDGTCRPITKMRQYHVNAWTGEYLCFDP